VNPNAYPISTTNTSSSARDTSTLPETSKKSKKSKVGRIGMKAATWSWIPVYNPKGAYW